MCFVPIPARAITAERVVLLQEELARCVEADPVRAVVVEDARERSTIASIASSQVALDELAVAADERLREAVGRAVGLPAEQVLRARAGRG